jgi:hypothetical protein
MHLFLVAPHQGIVSFLLHPLEHLFVVGQSSLLDDLADLALDAPADHPVNGVLLSLDYLALVHFLFVVWMDFGMESELLY